MEINTDTATVLYDNIDNRSVSSSISSKKNAELIAAAFGCTNPIENGDEEEEEDDDSNSADLNSIVSNETNLIKNTTTTNGSNGVVNKTNQEDLITIATSEDEKKSIQTNQFEMAKNKAKFTEKQESHYLRLKELREKGKKKKELIRLERARKLEFARSKRKKRAKLGIENKKEAKSSKRVDKDETDDDDDEYEDIEDDEDDEEEKDPVESKTKLVGSTSNEIVKKKRIRRTKHQLMLDKQKEKLAEIKNKKENKSKTPTPSGSPKKSSDHSSLSSTTVSYGGKQIKQISLYIQRRKKKVYRSKFYFGRVKSKEFVEEEREDVNETHNSNSKSITTSSATVKSEPIKISDVLSTSDLSRECLVCKARVHQDVLAEHCQGHFHESAQCVLCEKVSSNPSNFVTHILTHLVSQFYCVKCQKWFRQPIVYRRHQRECTADQDDEQNAESNSSGDELNQTTPLPTKSTTITSTTKANKRKTIDSTTNIPQQEKKRTRLARTASAIASITIKPPEKPVPIAAQTPPVKKRLGRPPKYPKPESDTTKPKLDQVSTNQTNQLPKSKRLLSKMTSTQTSANETRKRKKSPLQSGKKATRLSSVSSVGSTSNSSNEKQTSTNSNTKTRAKQLATVDFENGEDITNQSVGDDDDLDEENDERDDIDDIVVSDYEMDDTQHATENTTKTKLNETVSNKQDATSSQVLKPSNTNLSLTSTYKVKIQLRRTSNNLTTNNTNNNMNTNVTSSTKQKENINSETLSAQTKSNESVSIPTTPLKSLSSTTSLFVLNTPTATPSKTSQFMSVSGGNNGTTSSQVEQADNTNGNNNNNNSGLNTYECPECNKKFVSHFGLVQHYDQHPDLAVTCAVCQISFENHHVLILHYKSAHNITAKEKLDSQSQTQTSSKKLKKVELIKGSSKPSGNKNKLSKQQDEIPPNADLITDLSALPSVMTRTSRTTHHHHHHHHHNNNNQSKPSLITAAAILNHSLKYKTSGFADLSFIDFSCVNFPRIAQNFCEIWPRKLQSSEQNNPQPLHNYMCNKCGFYFPCKASLVLHKMNKLFASRRIRTCSRTDSDLNAANNENQIATKTEASKITSRCQLYMTNSKYLCYEKCLDEIITKIENAQTEKENDDREDEEKTDEFLKSFNLVPVKSLPTLNENSNSKYSNLTEKLLLKLRQQMLDINHQFIVDLDKWKFMHSSTTNQTYDSNSEQSNDVFHSNEYSNKIHLKPHVNLNRPLLIRSKKLKRNVLKSNLTTNSSTPSINTIITNNTNTTTNNNSLKPQRAQIKPNIQSNQQLTTFKSILNAINSVNITSTTNNSTTTTSAPTSSPKTKIDPSTLKQKNLVSTTHSNTKFSKPFFSATSGGFSAAAINKTVNKPNNNVTNTVGSKKRKLVDTSKKEVLEKKRKQKQNENEGNDYEEDEHDGDDESTRSDGEVLNENGNSLQSNDSDLKEDEVVELNDDDVQIIEENNENEDEDEFDQLKLNQNQSLANPPPLLYNQRRIAADIPNRQSYPLPTPPPLYKAPHNSNNTYFNASSSSSANSSILSSASGMNNSLLQSKIANTNNNNVSMPKLQPVGSTNKKNQLDNSTNYSSLMPKLKPYQSSSNSVNKQLRPSLPPPPPLTLMSTKETKSLQAKQTEESDFRQMPKLTHHTNKSTNQAQATSSTSSSSSSQTKSIKTSSENLSLKCKFCFEVFKGQSEFFQHVIESHPKMLEQRLNRSSNNTSASSSNKTSSSSNDSNNNTNSQDGLFKASNTTSSSTTASSH